MVSSSKIKMIFILLTFDMTQNGGYLTKMGKRSILGKIKICIKNLKERFRFGIKCLSEIL